MVIGLSDSKFAIANPRSQVAGQAVISFVFLIGSIVVITGITLAVLASSFLNSTYGFQLAERAQAVALSGVEDALVQLNRNKDFSSVSGYGVSIGSDSATVTVVQNSPLGGQVAITSTVTILNRQRTLRVIASRDSTTGRIILISWQST